MPPELLREKPRKPNISSMRLPKKKAARRKLSDKLTLLRARRLLRNVKNKLKISLGRNKFSLWIKSSLVKVNLQQLLDHLANQTTSSLLLVIRKAVRRDLTAMVGRSMEAIELPLIRLERVH
jgi:hypothetical protein